jgi:K+ transporter
VLSAVLGLTTLIPAISQDTIIAVTVALLLALFAAQHWGTHGVSPLTLKSSTHTLAMLQQAC